MNHGEPTFRGGPGQRAVQEKAAKLRAAAAAAAAPAKSVKPRESSARSREVAPRARESAQEAVRKQTVSPRVPAVRPKPASRGPGREQSRSDALDESHEVEETDPYSGRVRMTTVKNVFGVFLLPLAWVWTVSFAGLFSQTTVRQRFWTTEDFWFFTLGVVLWVLAFTGGLYLRGEPPLLKWYVRIHEYTHAIWAWLSNGKVGEIEINDDHGHILTNKPTVLVTLAPYFYPLPCVVLIMGFLVCQLVYPLDEAPPMVLFGGSISAVAVFMLLMGVGWGFHFSYSVWMIRKGQSDLRMHGNFFSLVVIYIVNLLVVTLLLIVTAPGVEFVDFARRMLLNAEEFSEVAWTALVAAFHALRTAALSAAR